MNRFHVASAMFMLAASSAMASPDKGPRVLSADASTAAPASQQTTVQPSDYVTGAWSLYRSVFMTPEGRIVDRENGLVSHSEGQGYGMLIAVASDDQPGFETLWSWTERQLMVRDDNLAAWKWDPTKTPHVTDMNNATDGDLLIAWALLRAYRKWGIREYLRESQAIVGDIVRHATADSPLGKVLLPGVQGFAAVDRSDGPVVNLSYWIFPAIAELGEAMPDLRDLHLEQSGIAMLKRIATSKEKLPSDWTSLAGGNPEPADGFSPTFGYNAVRIPLYLAWGPDVDPKLLRSLGKPWSNEGEAGLAAVDVTTGKYTEPMIGTGYEAIRDVISCSLTGNGSIRRAKRFEISTYFSSTLQILSLMALSERYPQCF